MRGHKVWARHAGVPCCAACQPLLAGTWRPQKLGVPCAVRCQWLGRSWWLRGQAPLVRVDQPPSPRLGPAIRCCGVCLSRWIATLYTAVHRSGLLDCLKTKKKPRAPVEPEGDQLLPN